MSKAIRSKCPETDEEREALITTLYESCPYYCKQRVKTAFTTEILIGILQRQFEGYYP